MRLKKTNTLKIKVWSGTGVHMSLDTRLHKRLVSELKLRGLDAEYRGDWDIVNVTNGKKPKKAIVTHPARGAYRYRYTPSQTDAEKIMNQMMVGKLPKGIRMLVTAHNHTSEGSTEVGLIKVLRCPCWTTFIPYGGSLKLLPHYQPDIGAWFIIVTKDGRIRTQEWLYPTFMYHEVDDKIVIAKNPEKSYANPNNYTIEDHLKSLLKNAAKVIMVIADIHVGEKYSLGLPKFKFEGTTYLGTKANKRIYKYWKHLTTMAKKEFKVDEVWIIGDMFAGGQIFEKYRAPVMKALEPQLAQAVELLCLLK